MPRDTSSINLQYRKTIGQGELFGPGFRTPVFVARGEEDMMFVISRGSENRPEGTRVTVCTTDEEYVTDFARGVPRQGPHEFNFDDGSLVWPTCIAIDSQQTVYISDEWLNRISMFTKDGEYIGKWEERPGTGDGELDRPSGWPSTPKTTCLSWTAVITGYRSSPRMARSFPSGEPPVPENAS